MAHRIESIESGNTLIRQRIEIGENTRVRRSTCEDLPAEDQLEVLPEDKRADAPQTLRRKRFSWRAARCGCDTSIVDAFRRHERNFRRQRAKVGPT